MREACADLYTCLFAGQMPPWRRSLYTGHGATSGHHLSLQRASSVDRDLVLRSLISPMSRLA